MDIEVFVQKEGNVHSGDITAQHSGHSGVRFVLGTLGGMCCGEIIFSMPKHKNINVLKPDLFSSKKLLSN